MTGADERRAVAKALLGDPMVTVIPQTRDGFDGMTYHEAAYRFWDICRRVKSAANVDIAYSTTSVLADLIEPEEGDTCCNASDYENIFICSQCGCAVRLRSADADAFENVTYRPTLTMPNGRGRELSFCPNCGAVIVDNE